MMFKTIDFGLKKKLKLTNELNNGMKLTFKSEWLYFGEEKIVRHKRGHNFKLNRNFENSFKSEHNLILKSET